MKDNFTLFLFGLFLLMGFNISLAQTNFSIGGIKYEITSASLFKVKVGRYSTLTNTIEIPPSVSYNGQTYSVTEIGDNAFNSYNLLTSITIPSTVKLIGSGAFYGCNSLKSITIPISVTQLGYSAFQNCSSLTSLTIPASVTSIGNQAFAVCTSLTSVTIPNSITSIGNYTFYGCSSLSAITIPSFVSFIGDGAFMNCTNLKSFTCLTTTAPTLGADFGLGVFKQGGWQPNCDLFVPTEAVSLYSIADQWKDFKSINASNNLSTIEVKKPSISIYPNPAKDFAKVSNLNKGAEVSIFDMAGKILFQTKSSENSLTINTSSFKNGVYMVRVDGEIIKLLISK